MHTVKNESLRALYEAAVALGAELLSLLNGPSPAGAMDRIVALLAERGRIAELTQALVARGESTPDALPVLQLIVQQQPAIEAGFQSALQGLQSQQTATEAQRRKVQGIHNLLNPGPRSRMINEYR